MSQKVIGEPNKNIVLETAGRFYIKVGQRYYEIDFRNLDKTKTDTNAVKKIAENVAEEAVKNVEKQDLSNYVTFSDLDESQSKYVTQRDFEDIKATQEALQEAFQNEFTESIKPATVQTMQMVVGSDQLQFQWIKSFADDTLADEPLYIDPATNEIVYKPGYIKHYTLGGPTELKPEDATHKTTKDYYRWYIETPENGVYSETTEPKDEFREQLNPGTYYYYIQVPFVEISTVDIEAPNEGPTSTSSHKGNIYFYYDNELYPGTVHTAGYKGVYAKTGVGQLVKTFSRMDYATLIATTNIGTEEAPVNVNQYAYNFLYAVVSLNTKGGIPSIATMNGFTEITPGQIRAYMFSSPDGESYLDLKNSKFKLGSDLMFENGTLSLHGGLLAGLVAVRDDQKNIVAGLNGSDNAKINGKIVNLVDNTHGKIMVFAGAENNDPNNSKFKVNEDGFLTANSAYIRGGMQQPMVPIETIEWTDDDELEKEYEKKVDLKHERYDNWTVPVYSSSDITNAPREINIPIGEDQIGRRMTFVGDMWRGDPSTGGKFKIKGENCNFYEDGKIYSQIQIAAKECVELFGFGESAHYELKGGTRLVWKDAVFYGWVVTNRFNINTQTNVGKSLKAMAYGQVNASNATTGIIGSSIQTADGSEMKCEKISDATTKITFDETWKGKHGNQFKNEYIVLVSGVGDRYAHAALTEKSSDYFLIDSYDDNPSNPRPCGFTFVMYSLLDWTSNISTNQT